MLHFITIMVILFIIIIILSNKSFSIITNRLSDLDQNRGCTSIEPSSSQNIGVREQGHRSDHHQVNNNTTAQLLHNYTNRNNNNLE